MAKYIRVTMIDGSKWDILASFIARKRALYYAKNDYPNKKFLSKEFQKVFNEEYRFAMSETFEIIDWLENNMNWIEVKKVAVKVENKILIEKDLNEGICNGEKEVIEK